MRKYILLFGVIIAGAAVYLSFRFNPVSWDHYFLLNLRHVHSSRDFLALLTPFYTHPGTGWRPLYWCLLAIPYFLAHGSFFAFQLTNIVMHSVNIALVFWFAMLLSRNEKISLAAAAVFAFHPALPEAVAIFSEIDDITMAACVLLSVIWYIKFDRDKRKAFLFLSLLSYLAAQLIREPAVMLPFMLIAYDVAYGNRIAKKIKTYIPYLTISAAYIAIRQLGLGAKGRTELGLLSGVSIKGVLIKAVYYVRDLIVPMDLSVWKASFKAHQQALIIPALAAGLLLCAIILFRMMIKKREYIFLALFICISLGFHVLLPLSISRRYLYVPAAGYSVLFAAFLFQIFLKSKYRKIVLSSVFLFYISCEIATVFNRNALYAFTGKLVQDSLANMKRQLPHVEEDAAIIIVGIPGFCENTHCFYLAPEWKIRYLYDRKDLAVSVLSYLNFGHTHMPHHMVEVRGDGAIYERIETSVNDYIGIEPSDLFTSQILKRDRFGDISQVEFKPKDELLKGKRIYLVGVKGDLLSLIARRDGSGQWEMVR